MVDDRKEVLPLRIVAARFISTDDQTGLAELDRITAEAWRIIQKRYWIWTSSFMTTAVVTAGAVLIGGALTVGKAPGADLATLLGLGGAALMIAIGASWRVFQYGGMKARSPQSPVYADPSDLAVRNLERLFAILQLESTPRPFYYSRNGARRYVDHRYFFGKLRAAHVAKDNTIRSALFGPVGLWFDRELFLEADIDKLIADAKAEPNRAGAPKKYDYTDAVISLIEHPEVRAIDITKKRGNQTRIIELLEDWYDSRRREIPSRTQLSSYAKQILETIAKNRSSKP
ncbi:hypothetical protein [Sphingopyxis sp. H115]|uniref:hypothetical protein n=1 Tax=Sphingopyxis sp. H115 TaxID=1759073 RepID=UPI000736F036|nr:hypothetical protein [Sphingopyxis sp. H115]KTE16807.1 hypothetical protein ATE71_04390 [Sphingopyxis sp. H115]